MGIGAVDDVYFGAARNEKPMLFTKTRTQTPRTAPLIPMHEGGHEDAAAGVPLFPSDRCGLWRCRGNILADSASKNRASGKKVRGRAHIFESNPANEKPGAVSAAAGSFLMLKFGILVEFAPWMGLASRRLAPARPGPGAGRRGSRRFVSAEQLEDELGVLVRDRERLNAELFLSLQGLQAG